MICPLTCTGTMLTRGQLLVTSSNRRLLLESFFTSGKNAAERTLLHSSTSSSSSLSSLLSCWFKTGTVRVRVAVRESVQNGTACLAGWVAGLTAVHGNEIDLRASVDVIRT